MAQLTLIVGGVRSGKSRWAEQLASRFPPVLYLATAATEVSDAEMAERIARHRERREARHPDWQTVEECWDVPGAVCDAQTDGSILVECLTLWLTNLILGTGGHAALDDQEMAKRVALLIGAAELSPARVFMVSNEVGCGIIGANALSRRFADRLGEANQRVAAAASEVYACVAGLPLRVKPSPLLDTNAGLSDPD